MNRKKVVVFGGGTGLSHLVKGLKEFPIDITAVISVADNGGSTGRLCEEFQIPAIGDIRKVMSNLSNLDKEIIDLLEFRFQTTSDLNNHALGNLFLTAAYKSSGNLDDAIRKYAKLIQVDSMVLPISEDTLVLNAEDIDGKIISGEHQIGANLKAIKRVYYDKKPVVNPKVLTAIKGADLIIFSMGSLFTSLIPNLLVDEVKAEIKKSKAPAIYISNAVNDPGESYNFLLSDYIDKIHEVLGCKKIKSVFVAKSGNIETSLIDKYAKKENKSLVKANRKDIEDMGIEVIERDLLTTIDNKIRHDSLKLGLCIFNYLMEQ